MPILHLHIFLAALVCAATASAVACESWSPATERSAIAFHVTMATGASIREQHLYQRILSRLLWVDAWQISEMKRCTWKVLPDGEFGVFSVSVDHPNPARRLGCLRAGV